MQGTAFSPTSSLPFLTVGGIKRALLNPSNRRGMQRGTDFRPCGSQKPTWPLSQSLKQQIGVLKVGPWAAALPSLCPDRWRQSPTGISEVNKNPELCRRSTRGLFCRSRSSKCIAKDLSRQRYLVAGPTVVAKALSWARAAHTSLDFLHREKFLIDRSTASWSGPVQPLMLVFSAAHGKAAAHSLDPWERLATPATLHICSVRSQWNPLTSCKYLMAVRSLGVGAWDLSPFCWAPSPPQNWAPPSHPLVCWLFFFLILQYPSCYHHPWFSFPSWTNHGGCRYLGLLLVLNRTARGWFSPGLVRWISSASGTAGSEGRRRAERRAGSLALLFPCQASSATLGYFTWGNSGLHKGRRHLRYESGEIQAQFTRSPALKQTAVFKKLRCTFLSHAYANSDFVH